MADAKERLNTAQWILERNLAWIASADLKVGVIVTINIAMLGGLAAVFGWSEASRTVRACVLTGFASLANLITVATAALAMFPNTAGPSESLLFFGPISATKLDVYKDRLAEVTPEVLLADIGAQIHRNAQIATAKFFWVKVGMISSFVSTPLWIAALADLSIK